MHLFHEIDFYFEQTVNSARLESIVFRTRQEKLPGVGVVWMYTSVYKRNSYSGGKESKLSV